MLHKKLLRQMALIVLAAVGATAVSGLEDMNQITKFFLYANIYTIIIWTGNSLLQSWVRRQFPTVDQTAMRLGVQLLVATIYTVLAAICLEFVLCQINGKAFSSLKTQSSVRISLIMVYIVTAAEEANWYFRLWKEAISQTNALQEASLRAQLGRLKSELNPHFLFNNFNTLAAVIEEDPKRAMRMLEALSRYYRYVLRGETHMLSTLAEELESLEAYAFLLKIRHEEAFRLDLKIAPDCLHHKLPTLTLQNLAENATKHNAVTHTNPLVLHVECHASGLLEVSNNLVPRHGKAPGAGIGLQNLRDRAKLLGLKEPEVVETTDCFLIRLKMLAVEAPVAVTL